MVLRTTRTSEWCFSGLPGRPSSYCAELSGFPVWFLAELSGFPVQLWY
jgi:hypothetical protein